MNCGQKWCRPHPSSPASTAPRWPRPARVRPGPAVKTMTPSAFQVAPAIETFVAMVWTRRSDTRTLRSRWRLKKPTHAPSGDQKGALALLGACNFDGSAGGGVERPNPQSLDAVAPYCDVMQGCACRSEREWHIEAGGIRRIALRPQVKAKIGCLLPAVPDWYVRTREDQRGDDSCHSPYGALGPGSHPYRAISDDRIHCRRGQGRMKSTSLAVCQRSSGDFARHLTALAPAIRKRPE